MLMSNRAIEILNWEKSLEGKNVHDQVYLFNKIIPSIFNNLAKIHHGLMNRFGKS